MYNKKIFKESLQNQFRQSVQMAIQECYYDYQNNRDNDLLHEKLNTLQRFALRDGFKPNEWDNLIIELCPEFYNEAAA
jgi:hypothetical protein